LFTRPRRMGKSLNMDTLSTFLDCKEDTAHLFKGLYIETSSAYRNLNQYPVVYLDFVNLSSSNLINLLQSFRNQVIESIEKFFEYGELKGNLKEYYDNPSNYSLSILNPLLKAIFGKYNVEPNYNGYAYSSGGGRNKSIYC